MTSNTDDEFEPLPQNGQEVVLAVDFDRYGTRLVTGSADHRLRVFDLNEKTNEWKLVEAWRGHNADVVDVKFHPMLSRPAFLASIGSDIRLKLWYENTLETSRSGRRFRCIYSQSPSHGVVYTSIDFACPPSLTSAVSPYSTMLAMITRDGLLSLLEPVETPSGVGPGGPAATLPMTTASGSAGGVGGGGSGAGDPTVPGASGATSRRIAVPGGLDEWREVDQIWLANDGGVPRGTETAFRLAFQKGDPAGMGAGPNYLALDAGLDARALTLAVTCLDAVHVYRLVGAGPDGDGQYRFQRAVAELTGAQALVRDVAWAPSSWRPRDRLATAAADGFVRLYEIWTPEGEQQNHQQQQQQQQHGRAGARIRNPAVAAGKQPSGISAGLAGVGRAATDRRFGPGQIVHKWEMVAELKQAGVWKVAWLREGSMLVSTADSGKALIWAQAYDGSWKEFADFGPDGEPVVRPRNQ